MLYPTQILLWAWALPVILFFLLLLIPRLLRSLKRMCTELAESGESPRLTEDQWMAGMFVLVLIWPIAVSISLANFRSINADARQDVRRKMRKEKAREHLKNAFKK